MSNTIYATFLDAASAERAVGALLDHGVRKEDVSVISSHDPDILRPLDPSNAEIGYEPILGYSPSLGAVAVPTVYTDVRGGRTPAENLVDPETQNFEAPETVKAANDNTQSGDEEAAGRNTAAETEDTGKYGITVTTAADAEAGAKKGAAWGAGVGIVAGLAALVLPGVGIVYGGGALAIAIAAAAGTTVAGAAAGALTGYLVDQGVATHLAERYGEAAKGGGALVAVTVPSGPLLEEHVDFLLRKYEAAEITSVTPKGYVL
jgi:hypothetical protein